MSRHGCAWWSKDITFFDMYFERVRRACIKGTRKLSATQQPMVSISMPLRFNDPSAGEITLLTRNDTRVVWLPYETDTFVWFADWVSDELKLQA